MVDVSSSAQPLFLINTGDSFYWCGIQNVSDFQVQNDFVEPYETELNKIHTSGLKWYGVLGNHEYGYNVSAVLDLSNELDNWIMDDRYYTKRLAVDNGVYATFIFIDSSPCVKEYRSTDKSGWDPCGSQYPTCSLSAGSDDFEGPCEFHANVVSQDCGVQMKWFESELAKVSEDDWLFVVGHHPIDEMDVEDFTSILQKNGFDLYLNGHAHTLSQYTIDGAGAYVTTGAGSMVSISEKVDKSTPAKLRTALKAEGAPSVRSSVGGHTYETVFNSKTAGFTLHTFSSDYTTLRTDFYSYSGEILRTFTVTKRGGGPSPTPTPPTPTPTPTPASSCCHYSDKSCTEGQVCCKSSCDDPSSCSYTEAGCDGRYGQAHGCSWTGSSCVVGK
eukprot:g5297.t1